MSHEQPEKLGRYEITGFLGKGAMGVVYEGRDPNIDRRVAIKTARRDVLETSGHADEMMERFLREAIAAGKLSHPNIVTVYDADEQDGTAYIAMEFLEGTDLQKAIEQKRRYSPDEVVEICATICDALEHAHERGVVHRDVKPANIMILPDKTLRVTDFGIARMADSTLTIDGAMIGTPHYMSPEQFMGQKVDGRSDIFSAGVIAYVLLTGERPFPGDALATVMHAVTQTAPISPRELNFSVSPILNSVVLKALSKDPYQRYQTAAEFAAAMRESIKESPDASITKVGGPSASAAADTLPGDVPFEEDATIPMQPPTASVGPAVTADPNAESAMREVAGAAEDATIREQSPVKPAPTRARIAAVAALLAVVVIAAAVLFSGGDGEAWDGYSVGPDAPHYAEVEVHAFLAPDFDYYVDNDGRVKDPSAVGHLAPATAQVSVRYPNGDEHLLGVLPPRIEAVQPFRLQGRPDRFTLTLRQEGYLDWNLELRNPAQPGARAEFMAGAPDGHEPILLAPDAD